MIFKIVFAYSFYNVSSLNDWQLPSFRKANEKHITYYNCYFSKTVVGMLFGKFDFTESHIATLRQKLNQNKMAAGEGLKTEKPRM